LLRVGEKITSTSPHPVGFIPCQKFQTIEMAEINGLGVSIVTLENGWAKLEELKQKPPEEGAKEQKADARRKVAGMVVGIRVALRFVPGFSPEGVTPYRMMRLGTFSIGILSSVLNCGTLFRLERWDIVFWWTRGRRLRPLGSGKISMVSSLHSSISV
jgi:hypothetical protein